jgi:hypothetical protein
MKNNYYVSDYATVLSKEYAQILIINKHIRRSKYNKGYFKIEYKFNEEGD